MLDDAEHFLIGKVPWSQDWEVLDLNRKDDERQASRSLDDMACIRL